MPATIAEVGGGGRMIRLPPPRAGGHTPIARRERLPRRLRPNHARRRTDGRPAERLFARKARLGSRAARRHTDSQVTRAEVSVPHMFCTTLSALSSTCTAIVPVIDAASADIVKLRVTFCVPATLPSGLKRKKRKLAV